MNEMTKEKNRQHNQSEVDRAARAHNGPNYFGWSMAILMAFAGALLGISLMPEYQAVPEAFRAAWASFASTIN